MAEAISVTGAFTRAEGKDATFETGLLAPLAGGAVTVQMGDTVVLVTATGAKTPRENADFFPLTVDVEERMYAAGRIPGSFFRREARAGEQAILTCRLIDRPLRPSFPAGYRNEVHVVATILGADQSNPYDGRRAQRGLAGAEHLAGPLRRAPRRGAPGLVAGGRVDPVPHLRGGGRLCLRDGGGRPARR